MQLPPFKGLQAEQLPDEFRGPLEPLLRQLNPFMLSVAGGLTHGLTFKENLIAQIQTLSITTPDDWVTPSDDQLQSGFTHYAAPFGPWRFRKDASGVVWSEGLLTVAAAAPANNVPIYQLPAGYAPGTSLVVPTGSNSAGVADVYNSLEVGSSGLIKTRFEALQNAGWLSMSCSWTSASRSPVPSSAFPIVYQSTLPVRTLGLWPIAAYVQDPNNPAVQDFSAFTNPLTVDWCETSTAPAPGSQSVKRSVKIRNVVGLQPLKRYRITFLSIGG